jgi:osmotically-inducible protein OsmY
VETFEGDVTLTGAVEKEEQRKRAEELARSTSGVRKVNTLIKIKKNNCTRLLSSVSV